MIPNGKAAGALLVTEETLQLSFVVGIPRLTPVAVHPVLVVVTTSAGQVMVGTILSMTVTCWVHVAVLAEPSVTVHVTVVAPSGNTAGASLVTDETLQLSRVTGVVSTTPEAVHDPASVGISISGIQKMVGFTLSFTVTVWSQVVILPAPSATVQVTVVLPKGNTAGALFVTEAMSQLSLVTGVPKETFIAEQPLLVVVITFAGQVTTGGTVSKSICVVDVVTVPQGTLLTSQ